MIYIHPDHKELFTPFRSVDDFLKIDIDVVRDFKNRKTGRFEIGGIFPQLVPLKLVVSSEKAAYWCKT